MPFPFSSSIALAPLLSQAGVDSAVAVYVELELFRAADVKVSLNGVPDAAGAAKIARLEPAQSANIFRLPLSGGGLKMSEVRASELITASSVESVSISSLVLECEHEWVAIRVYGDSCFGCKAARYSVSRWPKSSPAPVIGRCEYIALMRDRLSRESHHEYASARRFFFLLDCATHPQLHDPPPEPQAVENFKKHLKTRVKSRAQRFQRRAAKLEIDLPDSLMGVVRPILGLYRDLMKRCFCGSVDEYKRGVIAFANGSTRFRLLSGPHGDEGMWTTQPSSGYFFLFGELALLGAQFAASEADAEGHHVWCHAAEAAIAAQPVFADAYGRLDIPELNFWDFDPCRVRSKPRCELIAVMDGLTRSTEPLNLTDLYRQAGENASNRLAGILKEPPE